jgi:hypothetical protein
MHKRLKTITITIAAIALASGSCVTVHTGKDVTFELLAKMPPFKATVEHVEIIHSFIFKTEVGIWLKVDGGSRLYLDCYPANSFVVDFARSLHEGQSYLFPQVLDDYANNQLTNAVVK